MKVGPFGRSEAVGSERRTNKNSRSVHDENGFLLRRSLKYKVSVLDGEVGG